MEINRVIIAKKSTIGLNTKEEIKFGDLLQIEFNGFTYYFNVSQIESFKGTTLLFVTAEQTGSRSYKLCDRLKGEDISKFAKSECEIITDQSVINGVRQSACQC